MPAPSPGTRGHYPESQASCVLCGGVAPRKVLWLGLLGSSRTVISHKDPAGGVQVDPEAPRMALVCTVAGVSPGELLDDGEELQL